MGAGVPLPIQQQMGWQGKERERKVHAGSTPSSCRTPDEVTSDTFIDTVSEANKLKAIFRPLEN